MNTRRNIYAVPDLSTKDIISYFSELNIVLSVADILKPSNPVVSAIFDSILEIFEGKGIEDNEESLQVIKQVQRMGNFLSKIGINNFTIRDLAPDSRRLIQILSSIINFGMFRDNKKNIYEQASKIAETNFKIKRSLETQLEQIKEEIINVEQGLEDNTKIKDNLVSEINTLENELKEFYKYQKEKMNEFGLLKTEKIEIGDKLCSCQLVEHNLKQEITCLKTQIVSDPSKLLELVEEMRNLIEKEKEEIQLVEKSIQEQTLLLNKSSKNKELGEKLLSVVLNLNKLEDKIELFDQSILISAGKLKNWDSNINAVKIRINHIQRQINHLENKIFNLQEKDKKISEEGSAKILTLQEKYEEINKEREGLLEKVRNNNKLTQEVMFEKSKKSSEYERGCSDIATQLVNLNGEIDRYFNEIRNCINN